MDPIGPEKSTLVESGGPVLAPGHSYASITDKISAIVLTEGTKRGWWLGFLIAFLFFMILNVGVSLVFAIGVGLYGVNIPVA